MNHETIKKIEQLKQESRELTKEGRIEEATKKFDEAWDLQFGSNKVREAGELEKVVEAIKLAKGAINNCGNYQKGQEGWEFDEHKVKPASIIQLAGAILIADSVIGLKSFFEPRNEMVREESITHISDADIQRMIDYLNTRGFRVSINPGNINNGVGVDMGDAEDFTHDFEVKGKK
jgi:hypothetical protein